MMEYRLIPLSQGQSAKVDAADYEYLSQWKWHATWDPYTKSFYAVRKTSRARGKVGILMHRLLMELERGDRREVDHRNTDTLDNRRLNLRIATHSQNGANRGANENNTSGYKGVSWHKVGRKWRAQIRVNGRQIYLGMFDSPEQASLAYRNAANFHHQEFARLA